MTSPKTAAPASAAAREEVADAVVAQVRRWLEAAATLPVDRSARRLAGLLRDPAGLDFAVGFVDGVIRLAESGAHLPVNIGNPDEFTLLELATAVIEVTGSRSEIVHEALPTDDPKVRQPDIGLARELLGWEPRVELRDGLRRTLDQSGVEALTGAGIT